MGNIEKLYCSMDKLADDWTDMPETEEAYRKMEEIIGREFFAKYEDVIGACMYANEKQGFIRGFQYAVSLLTEGREVMV